MNWHGITALVVAAPFVLIPVSFVWYISGGGLISAMKGRRRAKIADARTCAIDTDCPEGYICISGRCVPQVS
jgi:hypothetical protein